MSEKYWAVRKNLHSYILYIYAFTKISSSGSKMDGWGGDQSLLLRCYVLEFGTYVEN